jgi:hypothetical protein
MTGSVSRHKRVGLAKLAGCRLQLHDDRAPPDEGMVNDENLAIRDMPAFVKLVTSEHASILVRILVSMETSQSVSEETCSALSCIVTGRQRRWPTRHNF